MLDKVVATSHILIQSVLASHICGIASGFGLGLSSHY